MCVPYKARQILILNISEWFSGAVTSPKDPLVQPGVYVMSTVNILNNWLVR